jgi:hypothetical protein
VRLVGFRRVIVKVGELAGEAMLLLREADTQGAPSVIRVRVAVVELVMVKFFDGTEPPI